jgi:4,5-DOPA dioxygenase extradiol
MFPKADIPVYQLSLDLNKPPQWHYELAMQLKGLREKGVLIVGSGNIVHNLGRMQWNNNAFDWAIEFDTWSKQRIEAGDHQALINYQAKGKIADLSIPTNEHYLPLLYTVALQDKTDNLRFFNEKTMMGSISMRSLILSSH